MCLQLVHNVADHSARQNAQRLVITRMLPLSTSHFISTAYDFDKPP